MCIRAIKLSQMQDAFASTPLTTPDELSKFYQETAHARTGDEFSDFVKSLSLKLEDSKEVVQHILFVGHPGCGKTTELYQLLQKTQNMGFISCFGRCDLELDSADIEYTDVLFFVLDLLVQAAAENNIDIDDSLINEIHSYWKDEIEVIKTENRQEETDISGGSSAEVGILGLIKVFTEIKGIIKNSSESRRQIRNRIEPRSSELVNKIQRIIREISNKANVMGKKKVPLVILDGLDKIPLEQARKIFKENGARFSLLNVHLIVTFPIALTYTPEYSDITTWFPNPEKLPMIKLRKWENNRYIDGYTEGIITMKKIIGKRADENLFEAGVLDKLIMQTGGYIRDLFRCISKAANRARLRASQTISLDDAQVALDNLESDLNGRYDANMIPIMKAIYQGEKYVSTSDNITRLLQVGAVLEYNGQKWCDLHPLVEKWLVEHGRLA